VIQIKGSLSQLMDEQANPKFTFASEAKQVFARNYSYEKVYHLNEKEANSNSEVEVKSAYVPSGPSGLRLFQFL